jgi:ABC-2 type transport system ATP-binding protein
MIEAKNISKKIREHEILSNVNFSIPAGQLVGFLGPNGAGKSTTMKILTSYIEPTEGEVLISGASVRDNLEIKALVGYLPEKPPLYSDLKIPKYLELVLKLKQVNGRSLSNFEIKEKIDEVISKCRLQSVVDKYSYMLSKGYKQKLCLAGALISNPKVLILDEPTSGLDPAEVVEIRELISGLKGSTTIIFSTHILQEVKQICDRILILVKGKIVHDQDISDKAASLNLESIFLDAIEKHS